MQVYKVLKINKPFKEFNKHTGQFTDYKIGNKIEIPVDNEGVAISQFWRNRIKDAVMDNCVEEIKQEQQLKTKKENKSKNTDK